MVPVGLAQDLRGAGIWIATRGGQSASVRVPQKEKEIEERGGSGLAEIPRGGGVAGEGEEEAGEAGRGGARRAE